MLSERTLPSGKRNISTAKVDDTHKQILRSAQNDIVPFLSERLRHFQHSTDVSRPPAGQGRPNVLLLTLGRRAAFIEVADHIDHIPDVHYPVGIDVSAGARGEGVVPAIRCKILV